MEGRGRVMGGREGASVMEGREGGTVMEGRMDFSNL